MKHWTYSFGKKVLCVIKRYTIGLFKEGIEFDQMINEFDFAWIHISLKEEDNRKQVLEAYHDEKGNTKYKHADVG